MPRRVYSFRAISVSGKRTRSNVKVDIVTKHSMSCGLAERSREVERGGVLKNSERD